MEDKKLFIVFAIVLNLIQIPTVYCILVLLYEFILPVNTNFIPAILIYLIIGQTNYKLFESLNLNLNLKK